MNNGAHNEIDYSMLESRVGYNLRRAQMVYFEDFNELFAQQGITPGLFGILAVIYHNPGLTQSAVSAALDVDRSAMVAAIDKLEGLELVERRKSTRDRRSYALYLTRKGKTFTEDINRKSEEHEAYYEQFMKEGEKEWLLDLLHRIIQAKR